MGTYAMQDRLLRYVLCPPRGSHSSLFHMMASDIGISSVGLYDLFKCNDLLDAFEQKYIDTIKITNDYNLLKTEITNDFRYYNKVFVKNIYNKDLLLEVQEKVVILSKIQNYKDILGV